MKRIHIQHQYMKWAKNRILPNPGTARDKAKRFLYHLFRTGEINQDERTGWLTPLANDIERLGWHRDPPPLTDEERTRLIDDHKKTRRTLQSLIDDAKLT